MEASEFQPRNRDDFTVAIICALRVESDALQALFDDVWDDVTYSRAIGDQNSYVTGRIGSHNVALTTLPGLGKSNAARAAASFRSSFHRIRLCLLVGICGATPLDIRGKEILLGDVVVSTGAVQYDIGRQLPNRLSRNNTLDTTLRPQSNEIRSFLAKLQGFITLKRLKTDHRSHIVDVVRADRLQHSQYPGPTEDKLFEASYRHKHQDSQACGICAECVTDQDATCNDVITMDCSETGCGDDKLVVRERLRNTQQQSKPNAVLADMRDSQEPDVHFGRVASGDSVIRSGRHRDTIAEEEGVIAFEMEGAGVWDQFPSTLIIKGVCDYADSHKNKKWQPYAAASAAACTKALLKLWDSVPFDLEIPKRAQTFKTFSPPLQTVRQDSFRMFSQPTPTSAVGDQQIPFLTSPIPFTRDSDYIERGNLLTQVEEKLDIPGARVALVGLGGVGKSQLAIEYSHRKRERSGSTWIFWVYASSVARFEQSYQNIADRVGIGKQEEPAAILRLVTNWLRDWKNAKWLMIIDNADDWTMFFPADTRTQPSARDGSFREQRLLSEFIPQTRHGQILVTSRDREAAFRLAGDYKNIIPVDCMSADQAISLFEKKLIPSIDRKGLPELAEALDFIPLAITQAAAYINQRTPRTSVEKYLETLKGSDKAKITRLRKAGGDLRRDVTASNSIIETWHISFQHIREERRSAADLLSMMCLLDRQGIPESLLRKGKILASRDQEGTSTSSDSNADDEEEFEDDIDALRRYSLIVVAHDGSTFSMHRLVQYSARAWLQASGEMQRWYRACLQLISSSIGGVESGAFTTENLEIYIMIQPHATFFVEEPPKEKDALRTWAALTSSIALYETELGGFSKAQRMASDAVSVQTQLFGENNIETIFTRGILACSLRLQGKLEAAESIYREVLSAAEATLGPMHLHTIMLKCEIVQIMRSKGSGEAAKPMLRRLLEDCNSCLGAEHPLTLAVLHAHAKLLAEAGHPEEAEPILRQVLRDREKILGSNNPTTAYAKYDLALAIGQRGGLDESEAMIKEAIDDYGQMISAKNPRILVAKHSLAQVLTEKQNFEAALSILHPVVHDLEIVQGPKHVDTLQAKCSLAILLDKMNEGEEGLQMLESVLEAAIQDLGAEHVHTLMVKESFASLQAQRGLYTLAEPVARQALEGYQGLYGLQHIAVLQSMRRLGGILQQLGRLDEAKVLFDQAYSGFKVLLGPDHPDTQGSGKERDSCAEKIAENASITVENVYDFLSP